MVDKREDSDEEKTDDIVSIAVKEINERWGTEQAENGGSFYSVAS